MQQSYPIPYMAPHYQHNPQLDINGLPKHDPALINTNPISTNDEDQKKLYRGGEEHVKDSAVTSVLENNNNNGNSVNVQTPTKSGTAQEQERDEFLESPGWQTVPSRKQHRLLKNEKSQESMQQLEQKFQSQSQSQPQSQPQPQPQPQSQSQSQSQSQAQSQAYPQSPPQPERKHATNKSVHDPTLGK